MFTGNAAPVMQLDPDFGELAVEVAGWTWSRPELTPRLCALLCLAADVSCGTLGPPLEMHVQVGLQSGATREEMREVFLTLAPWAGYPQSLLALKRLGEILPPGGPGAAPVARQVPAEVLAALDGVVPEVVASQVRRVWSRPGLTCAERALLCLAADVCRRDLGPAFRLHRTMARAAGASDRQVRSVVEFVGEYGFGGTFEALERME